MPTLLGFDFGPRKIGVAVGQTVTRSATPLTTLRSRGERPDWPGIEALVREWQPSAAVVGLPFNMDDTQVDWAPRVHRFARQLEGRFGLTVHLIDERLTSIEARRELSARPGFKGGAGERDLAIDALAAALILETWLAELPRTD
ncbi:Holliday junction resolvase RuvX [Candidatus Thiodictyon syntrophicum]|jgi:putative Holliday junction resolvase|uniref:Putative pre-16S rRNA nuclease n=1 Tax=Candidatus Thiodictyon syntrophicum TaxID=1166950 RepID=A0A2K8U6P0_9GAMM|nr:Holliday junction resolvase RuvX [Candidatus Thiodictyon syntrophicum]AUB81268.1 Holliday junction resolvase RuvX [Candidatus Thiodictyon syntrophicum]